MNGERPALRWEFDPQRKSHLGYAGEHLIAEVWARPPTPSDDFWYWEIFGETSFERDGPAPTQAAAMAAAQAAWAAWCGRAGLVPAAGSDWRSDPLEHTPIVRPSDPVEIVARAIQRTCHETEAEFLATWAAEDNVRHNRRIEARAAIGALTRSGYQITEAEVIPDDAADAGGSGAPDAVARDAAALVDAAAPVIRGMIADHLGEATGREMTERMAAAVLAPALRELARQARADDGRDAMGVGGWLDGLADALDAGGGGPR